MNNKPLDISKEAASTTETRRLSSEMSAKEDNQLHNDESVRTNGKEFSEPQEKDGSNCIERPTVGYSSPRPSDMNSASDLSDLNPSIYIHPLARDQLLASVSVNTNGLEFSEQVENDGASAEQEAPSLQVGSSINCSSPRPNTNSASDLSDLYPSIHIHPLARDQLLASVSVDTNGLEFSEQVENDGASAEQEAPSLQVGSSINCIFLRPSDTNPPSHVTTIILYPDEEKRISDLSCDESDSRNYPNAEPSISASVSGNYDCASSLESSENPNQEQLFECPKCHERFTLFEDYWNHKLYPCPKRKSY